MELDYKELQTIADVRKRLRHRGLLLNERHIAWAVVPLLIVSRLLTDHNHHGFYYIMLVSCLLAWAVLYSVTEAINQRRNNKQMSVLLDVAHRALDSDPANHQKLNELQALKA